MLAKRHAHPPTSSAPCESAYSASSGTESREFLDEAQEEPIAIRREDRDIAVVLSIADYERDGNVQAFLELRNEMAVAT